MPKMPYGLMKCEYLLFSEYIQYQFQISKYPFFLVILSLQIYCVAQSQRATKDRATSRND